MSFPPRGSGNDSDEAPPDRRWADASRLGPAWDYNPRKVLLGKWQGRIIGDPDNANLPAGRGDDRHLVMIAGSRAGKSRSILIPNLLNYPGSAVIIDPKGELAKETAAARAQAGRQVFILDPFRITDPKLAPYVASFNPISELSRSRPETIAANAAQMADALIVRSGGDAHWTDSSKNLLRGLILHLLSLPHAQRTLRELRRLLTSPSIELLKLFDAMEADSTAFDGIVSNTGRGFKGKFERGEPSAELRSIISTANEQTWPLEDVANISEESSFYLSDLTSMPMTIYLVLPATRLGTHSKWLRMFVNLTMAAIEANPINPAAADAMPVWVVLEEFAALGHMQSIETAAGFMAGMGCKLWVVLQDLTQLKTHYKDSWETFLGNAGVVLAWSNVDATTTEYLSKLLGQTTIIETRHERVSSQGSERGDAGQREQISRVPLLEAAEITFHFARERGRMMVLSSGRPPIFIERHGVTDERG